MMLLFKYYDYAVLTIDISTATIENGIINSFIARKI